MAATRRDNRQEPGTIMGRNRFLPVRNHLDTTKWRKSDGRNFLTTIRVPWPIMRRQIYGIERLSTSKSFMAHGCIIFSWASSPLCCVCVRLLLCALVQIQSRIRLIIYTITQRASKQLRTASFYFSGDFLNICSGAFYPHSLVKFLS